MLTYQQRYNKVTLLCYYHTASTIYTRFEEATRNTPLDEQFIYFPKQWLDENGPIHKFSNIINGNAKGGGGNKSFQRTSMNADSSIYCCTF